MLGIIQWAQERAALFESMFYRNNLYFDHFTKWMNLFKLFAVRFDTALFSLSLYNLSITPWILTQIITAPVVRCAVFACRRHTKMKWWWHQKIVEEKSEQDEWAWWAFFVVANFICAPAGCLSVCLKIRNIINGNSHSSQRRWSPSWSHSGTTIHIIIKMMLLSHIVWLQFDDNDFLIACLSFCFFFCQNDNIAVNRFQHECISTLMSLLLAFTVSKQTQTQPHVKTWPQRLTLHSENFYCIYWTLYVVRAKSVKKSAHIFHYPIFTMLWQLSTQAAIYHKTKETMFIKTHPTNAHKCCFSFFQLLLCCVHAYVRLWFHFKTTTKTIAVFVIH